MTREKQGNRARASTPVQSARGRVDERVDAAAPKTEGQRLLAQVSGSLSEIAARVGCSSKQSIANWRTGVRTPDAPMREALHREFGIPPESWAIRPAAEGRPSSSSPPRPAAGAKGKTLDEVCAHIEFLREQMERKGQFPADQAKWAREYSSALALKFRLERANELLEDAIVRQHPMWRRIKSALLKALERHPAAARDVVEALSTAGIRAED